MEMSTSLPLPSSLPPLACQGQVTGSINRVRGDSSKTEQTFLPTTLVTNSSKREQKTFLNSDKLFEKKSKEKKKNLLFSLL